MTIRGILSRSAVAGALAIGIFTIDSRAADEPARASKPAQKLDLLSQVRVGAIRNAEQLLSELRSIEADAVLEFIDSVYGEAFDHKVSFDPKNQKLIITLLEKLPKYAWETLRTSDANVDQYQSIALVAFNVLDRIGSSLDHWTSAIQILGWQEATIPKDASILLAFERAGAAILRKNPSLYSYTRESLEKSGSIVKYGIIGALGLTGSREAGQILCDTLGRAPEMDRLILQQIGKKTGPLPVLIDDRNFTTIRRFLDPRDEQLCREAALAVGRLEDTGSIPVLLEFLDSENMSIRENAYWALLQISALRFRLDKRKWTRWFEDEQAWWASRGERFINDLALADRTQKAAIINEFAGHRVYRKELTKALVGLLDRETDEETLRLAFAAIHSLRAPTAVPALIARLDSDSAKMREGVLASLVAITGESLGPEKAAWELRFP